MDYTIVIGLEVHVQLATESKMFSSCGTEFGLPPNTQTDPVSLGLPGTLPVMNKKAFELALKTAVALRAEIATFTKWDGKIIIIPTYLKTIRLVNMISRSADMVGSKSRSIKPAAAASVV